MSVAGSNSSQGTHSRSSSRSRSPPYNDGRYPPSRYRYEYNNNYRLPRSGMSADLDNYRDLRDRERDRERDRDRDRSILMRDDRYMNPRARERDRDDRYTPYYREDPHHYPPSSSMPRDYPKLPPNPLRREMSSSDPPKDPKLSLSSSSSASKDVKDDLKPPITPTADVPPPLSYGPPPPPSRYSEWRDRERERERDRERRYRDEDRRRDYDRRRDGYMRDMRYEPSGYGVPPPNYQMPPYGGDSYRPERDRDRDIPPSPSSHLSYYERDRLDDRDYYSRGPRSSISSGPIDYDRYRSSGRRRPSWGSNKIDDGRRTMDRDRPERISTNVEIRSGKTSPSSATTTTTVNAAPIYPNKDRLSETPKVDDKKEASEPRSNAESNVSSIEKPSTATVTNPSEPPVKAEESIPSTAAPAYTTAVNDETLEKGEVVEDDAKPLQDEEDMDAAPQEAASAVIADDKNTDNLEGEPPLKEFPAAAIEDTSNQSVSPEPEPEPEPMEIDSTQKEPTALTTEEKPSLNLEQDSLSPTTNTATTTSVAPLSFNIAFSPHNLEIQKAEENKECEATVETATEEKANHLTQEQIVERIDDIENQISTYEDLLEAAIKREEEANTAHGHEEEQVEEEEDVEMADDEDENAEEEAAQNKEEAKKQALQAMENEPSSSNNVADLMDFSDVSSPIMRKRPQLLINQLQSKNDHLDDELYEKILQDNRTVAQCNSGMIDGTWQGKRETPQDWVDQEKWSKPLYGRIEDYPCYKENVANFAKMRIDVTHALESQEKSLKEKELRLKAEYKQHYKIWKQKNLYLDHRREEERRRLDRYSGQRANSRHRKEESEEYTDNVIFVHNAADALRFKNDGASTPYGNGYFTSDAARSEAELLEIIQSLESAEMRNPESRAKKTTATIPPMILDSRERMRTFDDRSGLVKDPLNYYHTGSDTGDVWNQQEVTTFMESYMMYPKQFERISIAIGTKTAPQCVLFYYRKKKKIDFKALMKKGRRGKATRHRDRIAAAIRAVTGDTTPNSRKAKSKGSALMTDIGEAQVSRKAKEKDAERRNRERREAEQPNSNWDGVTERKRSRRPTNSSSNTSLNAVAVPPISTPIVQSGPTSSASDDADMITHQEKLRTNSGSAAAQRRKGRTPREPIKVNTTTNDAYIALPGDSSAAKRYTADLSSTADDEDKAPVSSGVGGSTKWTDREKEMAIDAFKHYGRDFVQVSKLIKTKTEEQCRNFYHNFKRRFGTNAFNEEETRHTEAPTMATPAPTPAPAPAPVLTPAAPTGGGTPVSLPTAVTTPIATSPIQSTVHDEVVALSGRTDLKAEEEDAAAALVGMFQMGANTPREDKASVLTSRSRTPSGHEDSHANMNTTVIAPQPASVGPSSPSSSQPYVAPAQQQQQQKRRRVRSASNRSDSVTDDASEWTDPDYGAKAGGRKLGRTTTLVDAKRPTYSSYWSVSERNEFSKYLTLYGRDWEKVASAMKSKTMIQVRNFYANNEEKLNLAEYVNQFQARQQQQQHQQQPLPDVQSKREMPHAGASFDTSAAHFQALQNFPFPAPIADQSPSPKILSNSPQAAHVQNIKPNTTPKGSSYMMNHPGYLRSSTPPATRITPSSSDSVYSTSPRVNYPISSATRPIAQAPHPHPQPQPLQQQQQPSLSPQLPPPKQRQLQQSMVEAPSAVTKVADLLNNNDDPAEPSQSSWETWFGS
ncbi:hypothetical protein BD408DRAFT_426894 [Parasitella parasitica]|nr:hypothetical protein BD408DRAFT_426894 [Parasitella parasitica]